jgi:hypothetical protein
MERRTVLQLAASFLAALPVRLGAVENRPARRILFFGERAMGVRRELRQRVSDFAASFEEIADVDALVPSVSRITVVVADLLDGASVEQLRKLKERVGKADCIMGYGLMPLEETDERGRECLRGNLRLFSEVCHMERKFMDLDWGGQVIQPHWPIEWSNSVLSNEQKQVVWELIRLG